MNEDQTQHESTERPAPIPCWNCPGEMKQFGEDTFYWIYSCASCGKEKMVPKRVPGGESR